MSSDRGPSEQPFGGSAAVAARAAAAAEAPPVDPMRQPKLRAVEYFIRSPPSLFELNAYLHQLNAAGLLKPLPDLDRLRDESLYYYLDWLRGVWRADPEAMDATLRWMANTKRAGIIVRHVHPDGRQEYGAEGPVAPSLP